MIDGWIKLWRVLLDKAVWRQCNADQKAVMITLLLMANHESNKWLWRGQPFEVGPGQVITSLQTISEKSGVSIQSVRTAIFKLSRLEFITDESTKTGRLISIVNWQTYQTQDTQGNNQDNKDLTDGLTKNQQRPNKDLTTNKNDKECKKEKKEELIIAESEKFEVMYKAYPHCQRSNRLASSRAWNARMREGESPDTIIEAVKNYAAKTPAKFSKGCQVFIGPDRHYSTWVNAAEPIDPSLAACQEWLADKEKQNGPH